MRGFRVCSTLVLLLAGGVCRARAATVYTYTGNDYQDAYGVYSTSEHVSGSFTVDAPLAANMTFDPVAFSAYSFSDGYETLTNFNSTTYDFSSPRTSPATSFCGTSA